MIRVNPGLVAKDHEERGAATVTAAAKAVETAGIVLAKGAADTAIGTVTGSRTATAGAMAAAVDLREPILQTGTAGPNKHSLSKRAGAVQTPSGTRYYRFRAILHGQYYCCPTI